MIMQRGAKARGTKIVHSRLTAKNKATPKKKSATPRRPRRWIFIVATALFVAGTLYILSCTPMVEVHDVRIAHATRVDAEALRARIVASLEGAVFGCIAKSNFFVVRSGAVADIVREDVRVRDVRVTKVFPHGLVVDVEEYTLFPVWCVRDGAECHAMEGGCVGRQIDPTADIVRNNPSMIVYDTGHDTVVEGTCPVTADDVSKIAHVGEELTYAVDTRIIQPYKVDFRGSREVTYTTDEGWTIMTDLGRDSDATLATAKLFMATVMQDHKRSDLISMDVRFPEKIFYKMKNMPAEQQVESVSAATPAAPPPDDASDVRKPAKDR